MTPKEALRHVIHLHNGQVPYSTALTQALKARGLNKRISQQNVSSWLKSPNGLPSVYCIDTEELPKVNFTVTKHMLRPDVFGVTPYVPLPDSQPNTLSAGDQP